MDKDIGPQDEAPYLIIHFILLRSKMIGDLSIVSNFFFVHGEGPISGFQMVVPQGACDGAKSRHEFREGSGVGAFVSND